VPAPVAGVGKAPVVPLRVGVEKRRGDAGHAERGALMAVWPAPNGLATVGRLAMSAVDRAAMTTPRVVAVISVDARTSPGRIR
jgi:hypothetical protein